MEQGEGRDRAEAHERRTFDVRTEAQRRGATRSSPTTTVRRAVPRDAS